MTIRTSYLRAAHMLARGQQVYRYETPYAQVPVRRTVITASDLASILGLNLLGIWLRIFPEEIHLGGGRPHRTIWTVPRHGLSTPETYASCHAAFATYTSVNGRTTGWSSRRTRPTRISEELPVYRRGKKHRAHLMFWELIMRIFPTFLIISTVLWGPECAEALHSRASDEEMLSSLELRALQSLPQSQCYEYALLLHETVEFSARQYAAGNPEVASRVLQRSQDFTRRLDSLLKANPKKLKQAEILLRDSAYRLSDLLHGGGYDDRNLVEQTLAQVRQVRNKVLAELFRR